VNGTKHIVEVDASEGALGLQKAVTDWYREQANGQQQRDASGKFIVRQQADDQRQEIQIPDTEQEMIAALAEARQKVQLGTLTPEEFMEMKQEFKAAQETQQSWQAAGAQFLQTDAGADWPGTDFANGQRNLETMQATLMAHDMLDAEDKVAALIGTWESMKRTGNFVERPASPEEVAEQIGEAALQAAQQATYEAEISACRSASEVQSVNEKFGLRPPSSSMFER
jgi:hypothetical protein